MTDDHPTPPPLPDGFDDLDLIRAALTEYTDTLADDVKDRRLDWLIDDPTDDDSAALAADEVILARIRYLLSDENLDSVLSPQRGLN